MQGNTPTKINRKSFGSSLRTWNKQEQTQRRDAASEKSGGDYFPEKSFAGRGGDVFPPPPLPQVIHLSGFYGINGVSRTFFGSETGASEGKQMWVIPPLFWGIRFRITVENVWGFSDESSTNSYEKEAIV
ncbi:hypothetical protein CDAR_429131 [Caerostris darwini]|uniref:Uncharacterized protein n=1 Tax=Caerostris darwini TaxID=1538125 RepID=A0AAV4TYF1_9ARAC|nr:hypothetical protein CDAR_429131 [Caerostris darwini]